MQITGRLPDSQGNFPLRHPFMPLLSLHHQIGCRPRTKKEMVFSSDMAALIAGLTSLFWTVVTPLSGGSLRKTLIWLPKMLKTTPRDMVVGAFEEGGMDNHGGKRGKPWKWCSFSITIHRFIWYYDKIPVKQKICDFHIVHCLLFYCHFDDLAIVYWHLSCISRVFRECTGSLALCNSLRRRVDFFSDRL